jgi:glycosyltransferase involved in cell wall biosynthesis
MRIALIAKPGHADSGVGRYTAQLRAALEAQGHEVLLVQPAAPLPAFAARAVRRLLGWDLAAFFANYPVWARYPRADVYHVTGQNLATLLLLRRPPGKTVVTVHDLIPWLTRDDPELRAYRHRLEAWFDRLALAGLRRAKQLIAVSAYTKETLVEQLHFEAERIVVVHEGVG